ncbi:MAG: fatty acid desaturase family protein [Aeromicrobium sp.]
MTTQIELPRHRAVNLYTDLARTVRESGLLRRRYAYYWTRISLAVAAFALVWVGVVMLGNSWFQLLLAAALGLVVTQFGFLGHDGAHHQMFDSAVWNEWTARLLAGVFAGLSYAWWKDKHNLHHVAPNQEGRDPDVAPGAIAFTRDIADRRSAGLTGWFVRHQGWLFFPLLTLEGINLHVASVRNLMQPGAMAHRRVEAAMVVGRLALYCLALLLVLPLGKAAAFFCVQMAVFGLCLGGSFAPNHKGMPIVPPTMKIDFFRRQVLMSRNVRGGPFVDFAMGGLNYQIEHHLFPSMPRPNLKRVQPIVREYCAEHDVSYAEVGILTSYGIVVDYLNNVGLRARGPFECPVRSQYRV